MLNKEWILDGNVQRNFDEFINNAHKKYSYIEKNTIFIQFFFFRWSKKLYARQIICTIHKTTQILLKSQSNFYVIF